MPNLRLISQVLAKLLQEIDLQKIKQRSGTPPFNQLKNNQTFHSIVFLEQSIIVLYEILKTLSAAIMTSICYVFCLWFVCLRFVASNISLSRLSEYFQKASSIAFICPALVLSSVCLSRIYIMSIVYLSRIGHINCLSVQGLL